MRKASSTFRPHLTLHKLSFPLISSGINADISSRAHPKSCNRTHGLLLFPGRLHLSQTRPSRNLDTLAGDPSRFTYTGGEVKEKSELMESFESAKTHGQMLKAFKAMEEVFDERALGPACLKIAMKLDKDGQDPEKALSFATKAFDAFNKDTEPSLSFAMSLQLMGSTCYHLKRFNDSLAYLNKANKVLGELEKKGSRGPVKFVLHSVQLGLANVKTALGRREEAQGNLRKSLEIKEMIFGNDNKELGAAYRMMAEACAAILNFREALPYCLKALEMHSNELGNNSVEVARDRQLLGVIYNGLGEHKNALEQNELFRKVLKNWGLTSDLLQAEIDAACLQIDLGKHDEAMNMLKSVVPQTDKESEERALVFIFMAKALCSSQEKFADARRCLEIACGILNKKETVSPLNVSKAYVEISMQYETMNCFEISISLLKKALAMLEKIPREHHSAGSVSARIGWLLLFTGKVSQATPFLESAANKLAESFGQKHFEIGYVYNNLGTAYLGLDRPQSAVRMFTIAKDIMDSSLGCYHIDTIGACQNLSKAHASMENYSVAIELQQQVVNSLKSHGPEVQDDIRESQLFLEQLQMRARGTTLTELLSKASPLPQKKLPGAV